MLYITGPAETEKKHQKTKEYLKGINKCLKQLVDGQSLCLFNYSMKRHSWTVGSLMILFAQQEICFKREL